MGKNLVRTLVLLLLIVFSCTVVAVTPKGSMNIYAVTSEGKGLVAELDLEIEEKGSGKIWSSVTPLVGTSTQNAEKTAVKIARNYSGMVDKYDYKFSIKSSASVVDGPSAGAAMALLTISQLTDKKLPQYVSLTGTINEEGRIGPVGGIYEKALEASKTGTKLMLIPRGEAVQTVKLPEGVRSINIIDYSPKNWGLKVVEVQNIDEAMKIAYTKLEEIDVNQSGAEAIPEFVPEKLRLVQHNGPFKVLVTNYIKRTKQYTSEARNSLSSSLLEDGEVTHDLLEILNNSEQTLQRSDVLNEQNYLYSAANFAFLARVNAIIVDEVSRSPTLLDPDSAALDIKLVELRSEISTFENEMAGMVPREGVELFASAQQRFTYARNNVDKLSTEYNVVVVGEGEDVRATSLKKLQDYAFAVAWLDVAKEFYNLSKDSEAMVERVNNFQQEVDSLLLEAETAVAKLDTGAQAFNDIKRRLDAAKRERDLNWFEAAIFDAASARALATAETATKEKTHDELKKLLEKKISSLEQRTTESKQKSVWAGLYLDHAKYFLESANYYDQLDSTITATESLKSGYSLVLLAEEQHNASGRIIEAYSKTSPPIKTGKGEPVSAGYSNNAEKTALLGFLILLALVIVVLGVGVIGLMIASAKQTSLIKEIERTRRLLQQADEKFVRGEIDRQAHNDIKRRYEDQLAVLEEERKMRAKHLMAVDDYEAGIDSYKEKLKTLKRHLKDGIVSKDEFVRKSREHLERIDELKTKLDEEISQIKVEPPELDEKQVEETVKKRQARRAEKKKNKNGKKKRNKKK